MDALLTSFVAAALGEWGDKTQLLVIALAVRYRRPLPILAGVLVAVRPDLGGYVVAAWLGGIILNLVTMGEYLDVALRDFGLLVAALALARLATAARTAGRERVAAPVAGIGAR